MLKVGDKLEIRKDADGIGDVIAFFSGGQDSTGIHKYQIVFNGIKFPVPLPEEVVLAVFKKVEPMQLKPEPTEPTEPKVETKENIKITKTKVKG